MKKELMDWGQCTKEYIREVDVDIDKVNSILRMCTVRLRIVKGIGLDGETASVIAEDYYEIIKELLTALLLLHGLKSDNHECLIAFFKRTYSDKEYEVGVIFELKRIRNRISYDGFFVDEMYVQMNRLEFEHIITFVETEIKEKLKNYKD